MAERIYFVYLDRPEISEHSLNFGALFTTWDQRQRRVFCSTKYDTKLQKKKHCYIKTTKILLNTYLISISNTNLKMPI